LIDQSSVQNMKSICRTSSKKYL